MRYTSYTSMFLLYFNDSFLIKSTICTSPHYKGFSSVFIFISILNRKKTSSFVDLCAGICALLYVFIEKSYFVLNLRFRVGKRRKAQSAERPSHFIRHSLLALTIQHDTCLNKYENGFESTNIFIDLHHQTVFFRFKLDRILWCEHKYRIALKSIACACAYMHVCGTDSKFEKLKFFRDHFTDLLCVVKWNIYGCPLFHSFQ